MIRVLVVDDEALIRTGFRLILDAAGGIEVVGAVSGGEALDAVRRHRPDVVLLDIRMPDVDGLTVLAAIRALTSPPVVAMLTTFDTDEYIAAALRAGASGFLLKDTDPEEIGALVRTLAEGGTVLSSKVIRTVVDGYLDAGRDAVEADAARRVARLTGRERHVLTLLATGLSNGEIGARLHLGVGTVKDHVSAILGKLDAGGRVQAALLAERAGLLRADGGVPGAVPGGRGGA
ncbi:response regulator [Streptomyces specialis]|uniref:response regulator n=1 Tax=Streptomyces specialis TaxID=498367 RepID=UPI00073EDCD3|nr:response regulator transcription factor [Streptomyces specialis]